MTKPDENEGFISRWSRRKLDDKTIDEATEESESQIDSEEDLAQVEEIEPTIAEQELPLWQQKDIDPKLKIEAFRELFSQAEFNIRDGLNDYDHDYTQERKLGGIVTSQMKRMLKLAQQKTEAEEELPPEIQNSTSSLVQSENTEQPTDNNEDDKIA